MKVVILAAGPGKRLGNKTKFFNKATLRIGDKAAISHIIDYFPKDYEFIIVTGYLGDIVQQYVKIAHPEVNATFVPTYKYEGAGSGPGYAVLQCEKLLQEPFYIWTCDTLVGDDMSQIINIPERAEVPINWLGYARADSKDGEYSCIELYNKGDDWISVKEFREKFSQNYTKNAYIGTAFIYDYRTFFQGLKNNPVVIQDQFQLSAGFNEILRTELPMVAICFDWFDTGDLEKLQETRSKFPAKIENLDKEDEEIYFIGDRVVKYFHNTQICQNRIKRAKLLGEFVPKLISTSQNFYSYYFQPGVDLFDKSIKNLPEIIPMFLESVWKSNLWKELTLNPEEYMKFQNACVEFYYRKTRNRLDSLYKQLHFEDTENIINGEQIPRLKDMFSVLSWQKILNGKACLMHGDMAISNILKDNKNFSLIDWRQDFGGLTDFGDFYYDLAKLYATLLFPHDIIKKKDFKVSINGKEVELEIKQPEDDRYNASKLNFKAWCVSKHIDSKKVQQLASIVLLNMSPLHEYPLNILLYYLGKETLWKTLKI